MAEITEESQLNIHGIQAFLKNIVYPVYHFDFETIMPAMPMFDQSRTYQQIPFQYSLHLQDKRGVVARHIEWLAEADGLDPRPLLMQSMLENLGDHGTIMAYHSSFEIMRIKELARDYPEFSLQLMALVPRFVDLEIPFRNKYYYHRDMQGKSSIKNVLPALIPELKYDDLEIQDGGSASSIFLQMMQGSFEGDFDKTREALLEYCKMDTLAMVRLLEKLYVVSS